MHPPPLTLPQNTLALWGQGGTAAGVAAAAGVFEAYSKDQRLAQAVLSTASKTAPATTTAMDTGA